MFHSIFLWHPHPDAISLIVAAVEADGCGLLLKVGKSIYVQETKM
jgi:hypothetical protein